MEQTTGAGQPVAGIFRTRGADGVVEFNDHGAGQPVQLTVVPAASPVEQARLHERNRDIAAVTEQLTEARQFREQLAQEAQLARAQREAVDARFAASSFATDNRFFPARLPFRFSSFGRRGQALNRVPYRSGRAPRRGIDDPERGLQPRPDGVPRRGNPQRGSGGRGSGAAAPAGPQSRDVSPRR